MGSVQNNLRAMIHVFVHVPAVHTARTAANRRIRLTRRLVRAIVTQNHFAVL
jgi:hypothetical protein